MSFYASWSNVSRFYILEKVFSWKVLFLTYFYFCQKIASDLKRCNYVPLFLFPTYLSYITTYFKWKNKIENYTTWKCRIISHVALKYTFSWRWGLYKPYQVFIMYLFRYSPSCNARSLLTEALFVWNISHILHIFVMF